MYGQRGLREWWHEVQYVSANLEGRCTSNETCSRSAEASPTICMMARIVDWLNVKFRGCG